MRSAVLLLAMLLAGCSGGDGGPSDPTTATTSTTSTTTAAAPPPPPPVTFTNTTVTGIASVGGGGTAFSGLLYDVATLPPNSTGAVVEARLTAGLDNPLKKMTLSVGTVDATTMAATPVADTSEADARGVLRLVLPAETWAQNPGLQGIVSAAWDGGALVQWSAEIHVAHFIDRPIDDAYTSFPA